MPCRATDPGRYLAVTPSDSRSLGLTENCRASLSETETLIQLQFSDLTEGSAVISHSTVVFPKGHVL
ncbi:unnamed protein product [Calypogeia fissa]